MQPESAKFLEDIREAGQTVIEIAGGRALSDYLDDKVITDFARIIAFRNILIHGYRLVNHELVWSVVRNQLPTLIREVEGLLAEAR
jgi:uncharacterized protein with HEPN domain